MKEQLITLETAKLTKEKGFDLGCLYYHGITDGNYCDSDKVKGYTGSDIPAKDWNKSKVDKDVLGTELFSAPTQSLLQKWLREKHNIFAQVGIDQTTRPKFAPQIIRFVGNPKDLAEKEWYWEEVPIDEWYLYRTYEEAFENVLLEALKLI